MDTNKRYRNPRIDRPDNDGEASNGRLQLSAPKVLWLSSMLVLTIVGMFNVSFAAFSVFVFFTGFTLCFGHSLGMHRRFIHRAYECPKWLEVFLVHLGTVVGISGPLGLLRTHDLRDWAQRQPQCHDYFAHAQPWYRDIVWQLFYTIRLDHHPKIEIEPVIEQDRIYTSMEASWMLQQLPWAGLLYFIGGIDFICWGIGARVLVSNLGHWLIGYFAHNIGGKSWHVNGAAVQGYNIKWTSILTMGECWHNNHHAFPFSAKLGLEQDQWDPGWWVLLLMQKIGLVWSLRVPTEMDVREELVAISQVYDNRLVSGHL